MNGIEEGTNYPTSVPLEVQEKIKKDKEALIEEE